MAITIKDIAKAAGVSHTTVSRALKGDKRIAPKTRERIRALAEELGYVPNTVARGLKTNRSHILGIIVRRIGDPYFTDVQRGIEEALHHRKYRMILTASQKNPVREAEIIQSMSEHRVDGVIICSSHVSDTQRARLAKFGMPTVLINNQADHNNPLSIRHDDVFGSYSLVRHLIGLGHRRIAYLAHGNAGNTNQNRLSGFQKAMEEAGLPIEGRYFVSSKDGKPESGGDAIRPLLDLSELPTAVFCYNDMLAIGAMRAIKEAGYSIPDDISIVGFDNIDFSSLVDPPLTTFNQPRYEIGHEAAQMMLNYLASREKGNQLMVENRVVRGELILRQSTAVPPS